jgi:DtxR family transcriptional regulator, Mn-dependent transcriptional regulator
MATSTVENYVKQLYQLQQQQPGRLVPLGRLAAVLQVVPGTVTTMVQTLAGAGLVRYTPRSGAALTAAGERLALHVLRRHRLVELFLVRVLGFDWSEVHDEAEELEHVISEKLLEKIDDLLGRPSVDPHGDPIPDASGQFRQQKSTPLADCVKGQRVRVRRVNNQDAGFLKMVNATGLTPDSVVQIEHNDPIAGTITLKSRAGVVAVIGTRAAEAIYVSAEESSPASVRRPAPSPRSPAGRSGRRRSKA